MSKEFWLLYYVDSKTVGYLRDYEKDGDRMKVYVSSDPLDAIRTSTYLSPILYSEAHANEYVSRLNSQDFDFDGKFSARKIVMKRV